MSARKTSWVMDFKDNASSKLKSMGSKFDKVKVAGTKAADSIAKGFKTTSQVLDKGSKKLDKYAKSTKGISMAAGGILAGSTKVAMEHEKALNFAGVQAGMTKAEMEDLDNYIKGMDKRSSSVDLLNSAGVYASAGLVKDEIKGVMKATEQISRVSGDSEVASDIMLTSKVAFDLDLSDTDAVQSIGDKFAKGSALAKLELDEINETAKTAQGTFKNMNMSVDDSIASTVLLAEAGYVGSQAGTMMNATYNDLVSKAEDGKVAIGDFKLSLYDANGQMKSMPKLMEEIEKGTADMSEEQRNAALNAVFGANSQKMVNAFLNKGSDAYKEYAKEVAGANGDLEKKYEEMGETAAERYAKMKSQIGDAMSDLGSGMLPILESVMGVVGKGAKWFSGLGEGTQKAIGGIVLFTASLSPVLSMGSKLLGGFSKVSSFVSGAISFFAANPIVLGIMAIVGAGYLLYRNWDTITEKASQVKEFVTAKVSQFQEWLAGNPIVQGIVDRVKSKIDSIKGIVGGVVGFVQSVMSGDWQGAWDSAKSIVDNFMSFLGGIPEAVFNIGKSIVSKFAQGTKNFGKGMLNKLKGIFSLGDADGDHRTGKDKIPYDNYRVNAHKGEMILTRSTAEQFRKMGGTRNKLPNMLTKTSKVQTPNNNNTNVEGSGKNIVKVEIPQIVVNTDGNDAYGDGQKAGQGFRDEIDRYFKDMGIIV